MAIAKKKAAPIQQRQKRPRRPHCGKTFGKLSGLASHLHFLHRDQPQSLLATKGAAAPAIPQGGAPNSAGQKHGKGKKLKCPHCDQSFARASSLSTHIHYRHATKAAAASTAPAAKASTMASPASARVVESNASAEEHLKIALQELTQRHRDVEEQLSRMGALQSEREAIAKQIDAVNAALHAFEG
jgi:hypothetical protein